MLVNEIPIEGTVLLYLCIIELQRIGPSQSDALYFSSVPVILFEISVNRLPVPTVWYNAGRTGKIRLDPSA